jgi:uncharacterized repeat protein (TIGR03806 family)
VGDGTDGIGPRATGQDISDLLSSILRIDVDHAPPGRPYAIPRDNPFVQVPGARPEVWAFGLRQPWRMNFDPATGELWVGDVGEERWESVFRVRRGGNYGWSVTEGGMPFEPDQPVSPVPISPPVVVHPHTELRAVIGGLVYRGSALPDLAGSYVYADFEGGSVWEVRLDGDRILRRRQLAASTANIVGFGEDARREFHLLNFLDGTILHLVPNRGAARNAEFPRKLSETGLFSSVREHRPAPGVVPYEVNASLWSDGASKERFIALPGSSTIEPDCVPNAYVLYREASSWDFPDGTVLVKTFSLGGKRIETRLLHLTKRSQTKTIQDSEWRGYTFRWNDEQTDADLVDAAGRTEELAHQTWRFPSRNECLQCHSKAAHYILGVTTLQLQRDVEVPGRGKMNQLDWFRRIGLLSRPVSGIPRVLCNYEDESEDLEKRARSYLHANCAHCHVHNGGGNAAFQVNAIAGLNQTGLIDALPLHGSRGLTDGRLVAPGSPDRSIVLHRMGVVGTGRMPPLASSVVDQVGMKVLRRWIEQLPPTPRPKARSWAWMAALLPASAILVAGLIAWRVSAGRSRPVRP